MDSGGRFLYVIVDFLAVFLIIEYVGLCKNSPFDTQYQRFGEGAEGRSGGG